MPVPTANELVPCPRCVMLNVDNCCLCTPFSVGFVPQGLAVEYELTPGAGDIWGAVVEVQRMVKRWKE